MLFAEQSYLDWLIYKIENLKKDRLCAYEIFVRRIWFINFRIWLSSPSNLSCHYY